MVSTRRSAWLAATVALLVVLVGCGDDDAAGDGADPSTEDGGGADGVEAVAGGDLTEYCAIAEALQAAFPTDDQLERYRDTAPDEVRDDARLVADAFLDAGIEGSAQVFGDAEIIAALDRLEAFEGRACGLAAGPGLPDGVTVELDEDAQRVDVRAVEYDFEFEVPGAGPVSFVMTNGGDEPHTVSVAALLPGVTLDEALEADDPDSVTAFVADSDVVGPGERAVLTFADLEPGSYAMVCFIPDDDGTPHALLGMAVPFTVDG